MTAGLPDQNPVFPIRIGAGLTLSRSDFLLLIDALPDAWPVCRALAGPIERHSVRTPDRSSDWSRSCCRSLYRQTARHKGLDSVAM